MSPTVITATDFDSLLESLPDLTPHDRALVERAYIKAEIAHEGQTRKSGEPYFTHCVSVASILADMHLDAEAISAALMHDIIEDTKVTPEELEREFSHAITAMVMGVTKITKMQKDYEKANNSKKSRDSYWDMEYTRRMLMTIGDDVRVVLIKLADRLHNMRTLGYMSRESQERIAHETLEIYAPLANRLGIWQIKWELEDLSFRYLEPEEYKNIANSIDERRADREAYINSIVERIRAELEKEGIMKVAISGRPKHIYSIYKKMKRKQLPFEEIFDTRAIRIIVDSIPKCYLVLGIVHNLWRPIAQEFDDYIAAPKDNFYQSLHTAVIDDNGKILEVQIRTWEMHEHAEYGVAAHWRYKEGDRAHDKKFQERLNHLRRLMEFGPDVSEDPNAFMDAMKSDVFENRIYVYTPDGDIVDLPEGATSIDFAYHIHTEIGHRCRGAKVHGKMVSLNHRLNSGDQVEIITTKRGGPSMDWLNPDLGYVKTSRAKSKIRYWFRKQNRDKHIVFGREVLERTLKQAGVLDSMSFDTVADLFEFSKLDDFLAAVGSGDINSSQITNKILENERKNQKLQAVSTFRKSQKPSTTANDSGITVMGTGGLLVNFAQCCSPMPGDQITGYITRGRGVTIHRQDCSNILSLNDRERLIDVEWGKSDNEQRYAVPIEIVAYDREGLMRDITTVIADERVNISDVNVSTKQQIATLHLTIQIGNDQQLTRVLAKIGQVRSVVETYRCNSV